MVKFRIATRRGDYYDIHDNGNIQRLDIPGFKPSGQWKFLGLHHVKRNEFIPFESMTPERVKGLTLLYKNGKPQYTVMDLDHGTRRIWGNTGVRAIWFDPASTTREVSF